MKIYCIKNNAKHGPIELENLSPHEIRVETKVWHDGLEQWTEARNVPEVCDQLGIARPRNLRNGIDSDLYDSTYRKATDATGLGIVLLVIAVPTLWFFSMIDVEDNLLFLSGLGMYVLSAAVYTARTAKDQNREPLLWILFAIVAPPIALLVIGQLPKYKSKHIRSIQQLNEDVLDSNL